MWTISSTWGLSTHLGQVNKVKQLSSQLKVDHNFLVSKQWGGKGKVAKHFSLEIIPEVSQYGCDQVTEIFILLTQFFFSA